MNDWPVEKPQGPLVNTADHGATATPGSVTKRCGSTWTGTENVMPVAASAADRSLVGLSARVTNARVSSATNTDRRITDVPPRKWMWARLTVPPSSQREMTDQVDKSSKNVGRTVTSRTDEKARRALHAWSCANAITASCWDIFPRRLNADGAARRKYWTSKGARAAEGNRRDAVALVRSGRPFGLIAYDAKEPVGFISAGPRAAYPRVDTCKVTPRIDDVPVWVVPCLYVRRSHRDRGVTTALLRAAVDYAAKRGAPAVEGYPRSDDAPRVASESAWFGTEAQFRRAGYRKVRGVRPDLPRGWAPRVTMRAKIGATKR